jgi:hypothetical protein
VGFWLVLVLPSPKFQAHDVMAAPVVPLVSVKERFRRVGPTSTQVKAAVSDPSPALAGVVAVMVFRATDWLPAASMATSVAV